MECCMYMDAVDSGPTMQAFSALDTVDLDLCVERMSSAMDVVDSESWLGVDVADSGPWDQLDVVDMKLGDSGIIDNTATEATNSIVDYRAENTLDYVVEQQSFDGHWTESAKLNQMLGINKENLVNLKPESILVLTIIELIFIFFKLLIHSIL